MVIQVVTGLERIQQRGEGMISFRLASKRSILVCASAKFLHLAARASTKANSHSLQHIKSPSFQQPNKFNPTSTSLTSPPITHSFTTTSRTTPRPPLSFSTRWPIPIAFSSFRQARTMATAPTPGIEELVKLTSDLSFDQLRDKFPACYPETNPTDVYRLHLTNVLEKITGVEPKIIYPAVQWTTGLDKGDLVVPTPALRVKGKKPDELAKEWGDKVGADLSDSQGSITY